MIISPPAGADLPDIALSELLNDKIYVASLRKECIKLCYSAAKGVQESIADAEQVLKWINEGTKTTES